MLLFLKGLFLRGLFVFVILCLFIIVLNLIFLIVKLVDEITDYRRYKRKRGR